MSVFTNDDSCTIGELISHEIYSCWRIRPSTLQLPETCTCLLCGHTHIFRTTREKGISNDQKWLGSSCHQLAIHVYLCSVVQFHTGPSRYPISIPMFPLPTNVIRSMYCFFVRLRLPSSCSTTVGFVYVRVFPIQWLNPWPSHSKIALTNTVSSAHTYTRLLWYSSLAS
jgi:hypothetical protein